MSDNLLQSAYRMNCNRCKDLFDAIARVRVALRGVEAELRASGGTKKEIRRVNAALDEMAALENDWAWEHD
jgi:hypothetical protein